MKSSTYEIVEVFYAENEKQYRVVEKKPDGKIQDVARLTSREKLNTTCAYTTRRPWYCKVNGRHR